MIDEEVAGLSYRTLFTIMKTQDLLCLPHEKFLGEEKLEKPEPIPNQHIIDKASCIKTHCSCSMSESTHQQWSLH